jgi:hypothetical protein
MKQLTYVSRGVALACSLVVSACAQLGEEATQSTTQTLVASNTAPTVSRASTPVPNIPSAPTSAPTPTPAPAPSTAGQPLVIAQKATGCTVRDVGPRGTSGARTGFFFEAVNEAVAGSEVVSNCIQLVNTQGLTSMKTERGSKISVNQGPWQAPPVAIKEGDSVRLKASAPADAAGWLYESIAFNGTIFVSEFHVRTSNNGRAPTVFKVGANRSVKQVSEIADQLTAGDVVEVDPGTYSPFVVKRSGMKNLPITIRGVGASRPVISGGDFTVSFQGADNITLENVEVTGGKLVCVRTAGDNLVIRDVFIHDCPSHGILGADVGNGTNIVERTEIARVGANAAGANTKHAIYVATDRDQFPQAVLRVQHSYIHDYRGNAIKSRSNRNEIYFNWIESIADPESFYAIDLVGFQEFQQHDALNSDVVGNVFVPNSGYFARLGGDGTGTSRGRYRLANNTVVFPDTVFGPYTSAIRLAGELESVFLQNNAFVRSNGTAGLFDRFFHDVTADGGKWTTGKVQIGGANNFFPVGTNLKPMGSFDLGGNQFSNNGFTDLRIASLNVTPVAGSPLASAANTSVSTPIEFSIGGAPLTILRFKAPATRPVSGQYLQSIPRAASEKLSVGAI